MNPDTTVAVSNQFHLVVTPYHGEDSQHLQDLIYKTLADSKIACDVHIHKVASFFSEAPRRNLTFGNVLEALKAGWTARLPHWSDDVRIVLQRPDENSKMTHPYLYVESRYGCVPWKETFVELLSECWEIAPYEPLHVEPSCCCPDPEDVPDACDEETAPAE